jgi:hypothetical protein
MKTQSKIVVFDLDETIGYFAEFGVFWDGIKSYLEKINSVIKMDQNMFDNVLQLYPEFFRPGIMNILTYLKKQKKSLNCDKIVIYTNNQAPKQWSFMIKTFFENKLSYNLFDQIIGAFKINGKQIEFCRTTNLKTHKDLIRCIKLPESTQICFLDDTFYPYMTNPNVYYINIKPYINCLPFETLVERLIKSLIVSKEWGNLTQIKEYLMDYLRQSGYIYVEKPKREITVDKVITKKITHYLHKFFGNSNSHLHLIKTKNNRETKNTTRKNKKANVSLHDNLKQNT